MNPKQYQNRFKFGRQLERKAYSFALASVSALILFGGFAIRPSVLELIKLNNQLGQYTTINGLLHKKLTDIALAKENLGKIENFRNEIDSTVTRGRGDSEFVREIYILAATNKVDVTKIDFVTLNIDKNNELKTLTVEMAVSGGFDTVLNFLKNLQGTKRIIDIESATVSKLRRESTISVKGKVYYVEVTP